MVKPDGVKRGLTGEIIRRLEQRNLKIVAMEMFQATRDQIDNHYPSDEKWIRRVGGKTLSTYEKYGYDPKEELDTADDLEIGKMVREWLITFMTSAPMVRMAVEGVHAVDMVRKLVGPTMPSAAEMGTIRGDYSVDSAAAANKEKRAVHNLVHASETQEEAAHEIEFWFGGGDRINDYKRSEEEMQF